MKKTQADLKNEIKIFFEKYIKTIEKKDFNALSSMYAKKRNMLFIGTDINEWLLGWPTVEKSLAVFLKTVTKIKYSCSKFNVNFSADKSVAWIAYIANINVTIGKEKNFLDSIRTTIVLENIDGGWLITHTHSSMPVMGQAVEY